MKTTKEKIEVMKAFVDGKKIQVKGISIKEWSDTDTPSWNWLSNDYRIKPEQTYRPYESVDEMVEDFDKRFPNQNKRPPYTMPLIWVRGLPTLGVVANSIVCGFDTKEQEVCVGGVWRLTMKGLFDKFTYLDGTPCGKLVE